MSLRDKNKSLVVMDGKGKAEPSGTLQRASSGIGVATPTGRAIAAIMNTVSKNSAGTGTARIGFVIDATGSRSSSWEEAQKIQAGMFQRVAEFGNMNLRLVHFGGDEVTDHDWIKNPADVVSKMAQVWCRGGNTQILGSLRKFLDDKPDQKAQSVILIGDSFEEDFDEIEPLAACLKDKKIKIFSFLDGRDFCAEKAFKLLSEKTGGAYAAFGPDMPLKDLCEGVAMLSAGGANALQRLHSGAAKTLLLGIKPS